jgi:hypothetical protein
MNNDAEALFESMVQGSRNAGYDVNAGVKMHRWPA